MKKICVLTAARAEYGLLRNIIRKFDADRETDLRIVVTGMHLCQEFGDTYREIEKDGFAIDEKIPMLLNTDSAESVSTAMGIAMIGFGHYFARRRPDILILLGDRYETLAVASAALLHKIPIAHIHGGEISEGAIDDAIRHAITKMSYLHFTSTETYRDRVIQMGEDPDRVFYVGAPGVENVRNLELFTKEEVETALKLRLKAPYFVVTYHPVTLEGAGDARNQIEALVKAAVRHPEYQWIFTKANADEGGKMINSRLEEIQNQYSHIHLYSSLGVKLYLSALKYSDGVIGNTSSGILEAPSFHIPTINIGNRQRGRIQAKSVINCTADYGEIENAILKMHTVQFQEQLKECVNPYEKEGTTDKICKIVWKFLEDGKSDLTKKFYEV